LEIRKRSAAVLTKVNITWELVRFVPSGAVILARLRLGDLHSRGAIRFAREHHTREQRALLRAEVASAKGRRRKRRKEIRKSLGS
jgi:hypothetical protein